MWYRSPRQTSSTATGTEQVPTVGHRPQPEERRAPRLARRWSRGLAVGLMSVMAVGSWFSWRSGVIAQEALPDLSANYGFRKLEIFKLQNESKSLLAGDLTHDGKLDLLAIDNSHGRLDLLKQRDPSALIAKPATSTGNGETSATGKTAAKQVNLIENDWRFEHLKIGVDKPTASLVLGDFNGDGRKDIAYFSTPDQLVLRHQTPQGDWSHQHRIRIPDVNPAPWIVAAGDLNLDGKDDLAVLGKFAIHVLYQTPAGEWGTPVKLMNTSENLGLLQITDLDGDGRNDLTYIAHDNSERPFCVRLQTKAGQLGPELRCEFPRPRGVTMANIDGKPGSEVIAIDGQTGRVKVHQLQRPEPQPGDLAGQLIQYGFGQQGTGRNRDLATGDLNQDGLQDVVVTDPEGAQVLVFLQHRGTGLDQGQPFPSFVGAEQVRIGDLDGDGKAEVVVLSSKEKTIGISQMVGGRLTFPQALPLDKEPALFDLADLNGDQRPDILYLTRERTAVSTKHELAGLTQAAPGEWKPVEMGSNKSLTVSLKSTPEKLLALDANRDGRMDLMIFVGGDRPPVLMLGDAKTGFASVGGEAGTGLGSIAPGSLFQGELDKPVLLVAQANFARNIELGTNQQWRVIDQYNATEAAAKVAAAATLDLDGKPGREIVLVDLGVRKLRVLRKEDNLYRPWKEVEIGEFPYKSTHVADLNGDGRDDLLLFGAGKFGVLYAGQSDPRLKTISSYETKLENVFFNDVAAGDLNSDGQVDLALIDTQSHMVEILDFHQPTGGLRHALFFKLYETKGFARNAEQRDSNPREVLIADVTGDARPDLVILTHDRVLVYPQDDGVPEATTKK